MGGESTHEGAWKGKWNMTGNDENWSFLFVNQRVRLLNQVWSFFLLVCFWFRVCCSPGQPQFCNIISITIRSQFSCLHHSHAEIWACSIVPGLCSASDKTYGVGHTTSTLQLSDYYRSLGGNFEQDYFQEVLIFPTPTTQNRLVTSVRLFYYCLMTHVSFCYHCPSS